MIRAPVSPALLARARDRAGRAPEDLAERFPELAEWEAGPKQPPFRQAEALASSVPPSVGLLFLSKPPDESIPLPVGRTFVQALVGGALEGQTLYRDAYHYLGIQRRSTSELARKARATTRGGASG